MQDKVSEKATDLISQSLNEVYEKDQLAENMPRIKANILSKARKNHQVIELKLGESINGYLHEKSLGELLESANKDKMMHLINDKLSLKIQDNFTRLKGTPVSTSLDKLNAISQIEEKTTFLVSNVLRDNLNLLLQNNIKTAVATNLSTLKDEEIQKIIEEFMGKELKPITYLGAGLGGIVGASLYNFNLGTNFAGYSTSFLIFALLGYLTNVIAIQMLFKPYKSHKIFGYNVQGVISKQKPKFAKSLGKFVDKELLAKNSVSSLFTEKREIILANLQEKFSRDNYQVLEEIILKSSDKIFNEVVESTRIYLDKNGKVLSNKFLAELEDFDLTDFDLAKIEQELGENTLEKVKNSTDLLAKEIYEFLQSETSINEILPDFLKLKLENTLQKETALKVTELLEFIKDEQSVNKIVKDYSYKFTEVQERSLNELVSREQKLKINKTLNTYIKERITSAKGNEKIYTLIEEKLLKEIDSHKKIGELFDGSLIKVLNDNGSYIIKGLIEEIEGSLKDSKDEIAQMAIDVTLNNLGFLEKAGYKMLGGDDLIHQIISNLADKKLPKFLETKNYELGTIFEGFINNVVAKSEIGDLKLDLKQQEVRSMVDNLLDNPEVGKQIEIISTGILDYLLEVKLSKYTHVLGIEDLSDLVKAFEVEIALLRKELANSIYHKQEKITNITSNLVLKIITDLILDKPLNKMTAGILYEDIASATQKLTLSLYESEATRKNVNKFIMALLKDEIKAKNLNKLMDFTELNQGLNMVIQNLLKNEEMAEQILAEQKIIPDLLLDLNYACESESKDFVIEVVLKSILKSAEYNINNILQAIDFEKVTEKEVNNMQTEEIEDLFNSFAGGYFRKLESYGLFGGVFGLHYGISIVSFYLI
ncbi:DUF445 family protein [Desulfonispora thiosulfatigenes]|nr:DUF445 family protein [Desulfonispora thiosulfatigenes]